LFYFDLGNFKIFGSSPEAQLIVNDGKAQIHPIAGTYRRTGNDENDRIASLKLAKDPKENAEHVMLVDLARNDLSRSTKNVHVETYKEIQYFSHVIHLVSKVEGNLEKNGESLRIFADTFPAGTLSGAPKYKAMELIDRYEKENRGYYGGAIGFFKLNGELNHAITIRSFLSKNNTLYYQAGAGIVIGSDEDSELQEVTNKSEALRKAIEMANNL
jgi:anthranilate synthase component 1